MYGQCSNGSCGMNQQNSFAVYYPVAVQQQQQPSCAGGSCPFRGNNSQALGYFYYWTLV